MGVRVDRERGEILRQEQREIIRYGARAWNVWRDEHPTIKPDLRNADLRNTDLWGANLRRADLRGVDLRDAHLADADLSDANLSNYDGQNPNLRGADFSSADLSSADLNGADLRDARLSSANLSAAWLLCTDLSGARLRDADLTGAELFSAKFIGARLTTANLSYANLTRANLTGAILDRADLTGANLTGVYLNGAYLRRTAIVNVDLSRCEGLEEVKHVGPSDIATNTLERTAAGLAEDPSNRDDVETFLRAGGVPESIMDAFALMIANPIEFYSCFISYSHEDKSFARRLYADLQARGIRCWLDEKDLRPGDVMIDAITDAIRLRDKVLVCCSLASLTSGWVDQELAAAFEIERREGKKIIIPLDLDGYLFDGWKSGKAPLVRERVAADFKGWQSDHAKYEEQFERVVKALRTGEGGREAPPESKL